MSADGVLAGMVILVTGAATSLGAAFSDQFEDQGATVWRTDIDAGGDVHRLDVTSRKEWEAAAAEVVDVHGKIDGLVNNAAIFFSERPFWDETDDEFAEMLDVNVKGTWLGLQVVSRAMAAGGLPGSVINLSSTSGVTGTKGYAGYGTTRWAVRGLTKFAAGDLASHRIRVNSLHPHGIQGSGMIKRTVEKLGLTDEDMARVGAASPLGRMGTKTDMAHMATFLLSPQAGYITGREFVVDGGATLTAAT